MGNTLYASFGDASLAEKAVGALLDNGVKAEDINVVTGQGNTQFHTEYTDSGAAVTTREPAADAGQVDKSAKTGISTTTGADAGAGAVKGVGWGAGLGVIAAIASLAIPGFGIVIGGGALAAALGGVAASAGAGAAAGAVTGYLKDQGIDSHVAENYEKNLATGGALVAVTLPSGTVDEGTVRATLEKYGASSANIQSSAYVA